MTSVYGRAALATVMLAAFVTGACSDQPLAVPATLAFGAARADAPSPSPNADSPPLIGDCNGDWKLDERDAQQMEEMNGPIDPQDQFRVYQACDIDASLRVDARDAEIVWTYLKEGKSEFPLGWPATCPDLAVITTSHQFDETARLLGPFVYSATIANLGTMTFRWSRWPEFQPRFRITDGPWYFFNSFQAPWLTGHDVLVYGGFIPGSPPLAADPPSGVLSSITGSIGTGGPFVTKYLSRWYVELTLDSRNASDANPSNDDCRLWNNLVAGETPRRPSSQFGWDQYYPE